MRTGSIQAHVQCITQERDLSHSTRFGSPYCPQWSQAEHRRWILEVVTAGGEPHHRIKWHSQSIQWHSLLASGVQAGSLGPRFEYICLVLHHTMQIASRAWDKAHLNLEAMLWRGF